MIQYKGYVGNVEHDDDDELFHGEVLNTRDVITFQGKSVSELRKAFRESIEDYLEFCAERGEVPDRPFSGQFTVRLDPELHRKIYLKARSSRKSLNAWVRDTLESKAEGR